MVSKPRVELNDDGSVYIHASEHANNRNVFVEHEEIARLIGDLARALADHAAQLLKEEP